MNAPVDIPAGENPWTMPLDQIDVSQPRLFQEDIWYDYFARLRRDDPVHRTRSAIYGDFWSVTKYKDIMAVDTNHQVFSSDAMMGGIVVGTVLTLLQYKAKLDAQGNPEKDAHGRFIKDELVKWDGVVKAAGIKVQ